MGSPIERLHAAVREYCAEASEHARRECSELAASGGDRVEGRDGGWAYSEQALRTFPRYQQLEAILESIEEYLPEDFQSLADARTRLLKAASTAHALLLSNLREPLALQTRDQARGDVLQFISTFDAAVDRAATSLPWRRTLTVAEQHRLTSEAQMIWSRWYGGAPTRADIPTHLTVHVAALVDQEHGDHAIREALEERGVDRLIELREYGRGRERELRDTRFSYDGAEGLWTAGSMDWMVQASHESSITFGGSWLVEAMRIRLPELDRYQYKGWDLAAYQ